MPLGLFSTMKNEEESIQRESYAREILEIPDENPVIAVLGIGYPKHPAPKTYQS